MNTTLAFDVYGTLIDTHGVVAALRAMVGDRAQAFSQAWRDKQLEYTFRRGLMQNYADFGVCTRQALDYTCSASGIELSAAQKRELLASYARLPAFADAHEGLQRLRDRDFRLYAFSNGTAAAVAALLDAAGIGDFFLDIVSVDDLRSFKPNPAVYSHFLRRADALGADAWMISGNPFDVIGAMSAGMRAAWVQRSAQAVFDPWEIQPTITVNGLTDLAGQIADVGSA